MVTVLEDVIKPLFDSSEEWIENIRDGDKTAFELLFRSFYTDLHRFLWGYVKSSNIAEDLTQEVFIRVWENREGLESSKAIAPYLYQIARNLAIDHIRHNKVVRKWEKEQKALHNFSFIPKGIDEKLHNKIILEKVEFAIKELPERRRIVFILSRYNNMTYKEISEVLSISINTVETQISRALRELRDKFTAHL